MLAAVWHARPGPQPVPCLPRASAGTSLGDPIEVGAAAAVLLKAGLPRTTPLHLTAAKSFMGHAEPAAGIVGITRLALIVGDQAVDPLLHLTTGQWLPVRQTGCLVRTAAYCHASTIPILSDSL